MNGKSTHTAWYEPKIIIKKKLDTSDSVRYQSLLKPENISLYTLYQPTSIWNHGWETVLVEVYGTPENNI